MLEELHATCGCPIKVRVPFNPTLDESTIDSGNWHEVAICMRVVYKYCSNFAHSGLKGACTGENSRSGVFVRARAILFCSMSAVQVIQVDITTEYVVLNVDRNVCVSVQWVGCHKLLETHVRFLIAFGDTCQIWYTSVDLAQRPRTKFGELVT